MSRLGEKHERTTVPQFGGWEHDAGANYSVVFSAARNKKKQSNTSLNYKPYTEFMTPSQSRYNSVPPPVFRAHPPPFSHHEPNDFHLYPNKKSNRGLRRVFSCTGCWTP